MSRWLAAGIMFALAFGVVVADPPGREPLCPDDQDFVDYEPFGVAMSDAIALFINSFKTNEYTTLGRD